MLSTASKGKKRIFPAFLLMLLIHALLCPAFSGVLSVHAQEEEKVRVGYFAFDGYHMQDEQGRRSGYGYDYLQYLSRYEDLKYTYIGYDKSWSDMQEMLAAGEIDLLTSAQKTEERMRRFAFSDESIGVSSSILTVKAGNRRYLTEDYRELKGIRVGLLKDNSRNDGLARFAEENGFTYQPVWFEDSEELAAALQNGREIDAVLSSNLRKIENEWIIAAFDPSPFYVMVKKGDTELLEKVNRAIARIRTDTPNLSTALMERYYTPESGNEIAYTAQERNYIQKRNELKAPVMVTINSGRAPVTYFEEGEARGIFPEIAKEVMNRAGLPYEFINTPPTVDARTLLLNKEADVRFDGAADFYDAEQYGFRITDPYLQLPLSSLTLKSFTGQPETAAVIRNSDVVERYVERVFDEAHIVRYDSAAECLDAVLTGKQDTAFFQTYIAQQFVGEDVRNRLREQLVPGYEMNFAIAVAQDDPLLFSVLNKAAMSLSSEEIDHIVLEQTSVSVRDKSLTAFLYDNPLLIVAGLAVAACFVIILVLYVYRQKNLKLERDKSREFERFISYVCKANDMVIEVDLKEHKAQLYQVLAGKISCRAADLKEERFQTDNIHPQDRENADRLLRRENIDRLAHTGEEAYFECRTRNGEGEPYQWFAYTLQGMPGEEPGTGSLILFAKNIDQTKREEAEKRQALQDALAAAKQAEEAKGSFLSRMSHEIRTPLNAIIGYLTIAASSLSKPAKAEECLEKSEFAAHHLLNIVNDVLDISAIESGKLTIAQEAFSLSQLISGISSVFHTQADGKGVKFSVKLKGLTEETLIGDRLRINQVLMNLLSNAVKFTPAGGSVTLTVRQLAVAEGRVFLQLEVEDTGIGMTEEYQQRLYRPFEQQDASTARRFGGTGLGLSITRNLVMLMGGTIEVYSKENKGTRFTVNLSAGVSEKKKPEQAGVCDFSRLRVLVLYDEKSDYAGVASLLERFGVAHDIMLNRGEALQKIEREKEKGKEYDLCLLDWDMSGADVNALAEQVRAAGTRQKPVIAAAAYEEPVLTDGRVAVSRFVRKPVFQSSVFDLLSELCMPQKTGPKKEKEQNDFGLAGVRILMAEDNEMNMEIAREILSAHGLVIDCAVNGKEAAELFACSAAGTYQAVLMDIQMPVLNGYEAARRIRSCSHPQAQTVPIIALTADAFTEDINRALAAGMNGHVSKPVDFDKLCRTLAAFLT